MISEMAGERKKTFWQAAADADFRTELYENDFRLTPPLSPEDEEAIVQHVRIVSKAAKSAQLKKNLRHAKKQPKLGNGQ